LGVIISLVVAYIILVVLIILLILLWLRVKTLKSSNTDFDDSNNVEDFVINYVESEEPYTSTNVLYPPVAFGNFKNHVESLKAEGQMSKLFQYLKDLATEQERRLQLSVNAANEMKSRNRYSDIIPYDQSMVILGRKWPLPLTDPKPNVISGLLSAAYVNASFVRGPILTPTGCAVPATYSQSPDYITTQGPLENTVADFLTMIYQQRVPHIMMLCR
uniref:Tyrosine-protein phosphatase domain-containing protein n=1 Tax=Rodentolepis nana TaxID=102285 RepID=A0A0R3TEI7_RODNA